MGVSFAVVKVVSSVPVESVGLRLLIEGGGSIDGSSAVFVVSFEEDDLSRLDLLRFFFFLLDLDRRSLPPSLPSFFSIYQRLFAIIELKINLRVLNPVVHWSSKFGNHRRRTVYEASWVPSYIHCVCTIGTHLLRRIKLKN